MERYLVQTQGSDADPNFAEQMIHIGDANTYFLDFFQGKGIKTLKAIPKGHDDYEKCRNPVVNSCHGNLSLTLMRCEDIEQLAIDNKVVMLQQGGRYFAKPGLEAALLPTLPVISVPLPGYFGGMDAFLAPSLPKGAAAIGGVGIQNYTAAAWVAKEMLNDGITSDPFEGVYVHNTSPKLEEWLDKFGISILGYSYESDGLVVGSTMVDATLIREVDSRGVISIFTPTINKDPSDAVRFMNICRELKQSVWTLGEENVAIMAAKVMAPYNQTAEQELLKLAATKADTYHTGHITKKSFEGGK